MKWSPRNHLCLVLLRAWCRFPRIPWRLQQVRKVSCSAALGARRRFKFIRIPIPTLCTATLQQLPALLLELGHRLLILFIALHFRPHTNSHILAVLTSTAAGCVLSRRLQDFPVSARAFEASWADKLFAASVTAASVIAAQLSCPRPRYRALASQQQIYAIIWLRAREQRVIRCLLIASSRAGCRLVRHPDVGWQRVPRCTIGGFWPGIPPHTPPLTSTKLFSHRDCGSDSPLLLVCRVRNVCCTIEEGIMCHSGDGHASAAPSRDDPASVSLS